MKPKGMRDVATLQRRAPRALPQSREQIVQELAHLEHAKVRLERELGIWRANVQRTETRLNDVEERLTALHQALLAGLPEQAQRLRPRRAPAQRETGEQPSQSWRKVAVEY
jgi:hypothetical protein